METTTNLNPLADAERALTDAGIDFIVVDRCPAADCVECAERVEFAPAA